MLHQLTLPLTHSAISSRESEGGPWLSNSPDGLRIARSGPDLAHANLSARQAKAMGLLTSGISGRTSTGSSSSVALQQSLESRLQARLLGLGSTLYSLTWKPWTMPGGAIAFPSAGVGAPHIRDRTYWVGFAAGVGRQGERDQPEHQLAGQAGPHGLRWLADAEQHDRGCKAEGSDHRKQESDRSADQHGGHRGTPLRMADASGERWIGRRPGEESSEPGAVERLERLRDAVRLANAGDQRFDGLHPLLQWEESRRITRDSLETSGSGPLAGFWRTADWLRCRDDRWRPVEPGTFPLAHGVSARVVRLRGYGNAINPHQAAEFILAAEESRIAMAEKIMAHAGGRKEVLHEVA